MIRPYVDLLRQPGALAFSSAGLLARMPMSMTGLGIVLLVSAETGSYTLAGALAAVFALSAAFLSPIGSRLVDRYGQARLLPVLAGVGGLAMLTFAWAAVDELSPAVLAVIAAVAGAVQPNIGALVRARWSARLSGTPQLTTAFALESVLDEMVFVVGPPLATILATTVAPASALLIAATLLIVGSALLAVQRRTQPLPSRHDDEPRATSALRLPVVLIIGVIFLLLGGVFGATDVTVVAFAQQRGMGAMAGVLLALFAVGSLTGGLLYGTLELPVPLPRQLWMSLAALAAGCALIPFVGTLWLLGALALVAGFAVAPTLIIGMTIVENIVPGRQLTEAISWATTGIAFGVAMSAAGAGVLIDHVGTSAAFTIPVVSAGAAAGVAYVARGRLTTLWRAESTPGAGPEESVRRD